MRKAFSPAVLVVLFLTILGGCLRLYNLRGTLQFLGDQGRDALIVRSILIEKNPVFIGPVTSVGNMYLGPLYYYMMLPFTALTYPDPMGPVYAMALLGTATIPLLYVLGKDVVGEKAAVFSCVFYTFMWTAIELTRFSWNPNPAPFFSLIMIWATYRAVWKHPRYWLLVSICGSVLIQLHYLTLLSVGAAGVVWMWSVFRLRFFASTKRKEWMRVGGFTVLALAIFFLSLTPLILFDIKHEFINLRAFGALVFGDEDQIRGARSLWMIVRETHGRGMHILFDVTMRQVRWLNSLLLMTVAAGVPVLLWRRRAHPQTRGVMLCVVWIVVGIIGTAVYRSTVFSHYIAYLFPIATLFLGWIMSVLWQWLYVRPSVIVFLIYFFITNVSQYSYRTLGWSIDDMQQVADAIERRVEKDEKYNIVLLAAHKDIDAMNYRYLLTVTPTPPLPRERFGEVDTLFIINEEKIVKNVTDSPIYEIVVFPNKTVSEVFHVDDGPEVTVLRRHTPPINSTPIDQP